MDPLEVEGLSKRYGRVEALSDVGFTVRAGEIFGYLGPNGAGKTTTMRVLVGLVRADRGTTRLLGDASRRASARERIGYLPGELSLEGDMTGWAVLGHFARFRPSRPPVLRDSLLETLGLRGDDLERRVKFLSHGTRQKVGLVAALQHDPDLMILDEPTTGLDPLVQRGLRDHLVGRAAAGRAVLFSSHVLSEVEAVCARVGVLNRGRLLAVEEVARLRARVPRRMHVRLRGAAPGDLAQVPGVAACRIDGAGAELSIVGDINPLLRRLAQLDVETIAFPEAQLEDIFMSYFRGTGDAAR
jgi:ABC-2 type transport system ATP-binding protein